MYRSIGFHFLVAGKKALFLYGHADGTWEVTRPEETAPPEMPEPVVGINFVRDDMTRLDWLSRVAVHADSWLAGVSHFFGATLNTNQRYLLETIKPSSACVGYACELFTTKLKYKIYASRYIYLSTST
jgi:hypothetical protein